MNACAFVHVSKPMVVDGIAYRNVVERQGGKFVLSSDIDGAITPYDIFDTIESAVIAADDPLYVPE